MRKVKKVLAITGLLQIHDYLGLEIKMLNLNPNYYYKLGAVTIIEKGIKKCARRIKCENELRNLKI